MDYNHSLSHYGITAAIPNGTPAGTSITYPLVQILNRTKHYVGFKDSNGLTHHILNCKVSAKRIPRSEETDNFVDPILHPAQILTRVTHYSQDGSAQEYDKVSDVTFNPRRREVSFVTEDGQKMTIQSEPVCIDEHFRPYDRSTDYTLYPTLAPIYPLWTVVPPGDDLE